MGLADAIREAGQIPPASASQAEKKRYSELLSQHLAWKVADGLRSIGIKPVRPEPRGPGEREFQGGLGPKKVDVSHSDERNGLLLAVSIKSISFAPFGKNLKNRFADFCTEAITLHLRFPYAVVNALFVFPSAADSDTTPGRRISTFSRATRLLATISGRREYTDPGEKFENVSMLLFEPLSPTCRQPWTKIINTETGREVTEDQYFTLLRERFYARNPHLAVLDDFAEG